MSNEAAPAVLVVGVGSADRGDDSVGLLVARRVAAENLPQAAVLMETGDISALIAAWQPYDRVILVDAVMSGAEPGTIHRVVVSDSLPTDELVTSTHGFGVAQAVELARALGLLPRHLVLYTVEGRQFTIGAPLSPEVEAAVERVAQLISQEVGKRCA